MPWNPLVTIAAGFAVVGIGVVLGRFTGRRARQIRELESRAEALGKEREHALAEAAAAKEATARVQQQLESYRASVADHFSGTSALLRDLTLRYRAVYDHLTKGAGALCPEAFVGLDEGRAEALPPGGDPPEPPSEDAEER